MELNYEVKIDTTGAQKATKDLEAMFEQMAKSSDESIRSLSAYGKDFVTQLQSGKLSVKDINAYIRSLRTDIVKMYKSGSIGSKESKDQIRGVSKELQVLRRELSNVNAEASKIHSNGGIYGKIGALAGGYMSISALTNLSRQIVSVRGQFQQLEISFSTMLGSEEKAVALMDQLVETAAKTPFDLQSISQGAKQLLAYGEASETVNDTLVRLGNIASGLSIPLNDLVYLYGTTQVQGRVFTQDIRQFLGRGIPIVKELSKQLGVTEEEINKMVTAGKIGFDDIKKSLEAMTNEGGMFYNLMEKQSASLTGQLSNLEDAFDSMLNEIGKATQSVFSQGISIVSTLIENYKTIGKVILSLCEVYGVYKAALIASYVVENRTVLLRQAHIKVIKLQAAAQSILNKVMSVNPYVAIGAAIVSLIALSATWKEKVDHNAKAQEELNKELEASDAAIKSNMDAVKQSIGVIQDKTKTIYEQIEAYNELQKREGSFKGMSVEEIQGLSQEDINEKIQKDTFTARRREAKRIYEEAAAEEKRARELYERKVQSSGFEQRYLDDLLVKEEKAKNALVNYNKALKDIADEEEAVAFQRLTTEEKVNVLKRRNAELQKSIDALEARRGVNPITKRSTISISELDEIEKYKKQIEANDRQLEAITAKPTKDYEYWENRKKEATKAFHKALPGTAAFNEAKANIAEAIRQMQAWEEQTSKNDDSLKRMRETLKDMAFKAKQLAALDGKTGFEEQRIAARNDYDSKIYESDKQRETMLAVQGITSADRKEIKARFDEYNMGLMKAHQKTIEVIDEEEREFKANLNAAIEDYWMGDLDKEIADIERWVKEKIKEIRKNLKTEDQGALEAEIKRLREVKTEDARLKETIRLINEEGEAKERLIELSEEYSDNEAKEIALKEAQRETIKKTMEAISAQKNINDEEKRQLADLEYTYNKLGQAIEKTREELMLYNEEARRSAVINGINGIGGALSSSSNAYVSAIGSMLSNMSGLQDIARLKQQQLAYMKAEDQAWMRGDFESADIARSGANATKAQAAASVATAAISFGVDVFNAFAESAEQRRQALAEWNAKVEDSAHRLAMLTLEEFEYKQKNIYGVDDPYNRLAALIKKDSQAQSEASKALAKLANEGIVQTGTKKKADGKTVFQMAASGAGSGALIGAAAGSASSPIGTIIGTAAGAIVGSVVGILAGRKEVAVYDSLRNRYGEIYDSQTLEINKEILADYDKMDDATKRLIDNAQELLDVQKEAREEYAEYIKQLTGEMGDDISQILINAFRNKDIYEAMDDMRDYLGDTIAAILHQQVFGAVFGDMFTGLEKQLSGIFDENGKRVGSITEVLASYPYRLEKGMESYFSTMVELEKYFKEAGFDNIFSPETDSSQQALQGTVAGMSEDTAGKINGNFLGLKMTAMEISDRVSSISGMVDEANRIANRSLDALNEIAENTFYCRKLDRLASDIADMKANGIICR